nr:permease prefix domain 1-containing protein [uncultured Oscillibacter sp.]
MRNNFQIWINAVCEQVRFRPDHRSIEFELRDHYEEHVRDLIRLGRPRELAEERALEAMGNAQEVGRALDMVHKPWLGWLWEASRALALALTVLTLVTLLWTVGLNSLVERTIDELTWEEPPASAVKAELEHGTLYAAPGEVTQEPGGKATAGIRLWLQMRDPLGTDPYYGIKNWFFTYRDEHGELSVQETDPLTRTAAASRYWRNPGVSRVGWTRHSQTVELVLDGPPRWAEVSYPLSGQDWVLRVEWEAEP